MSIFICLSSVERYCGICYPLNSRIRGTRRLVLYLLPVFIFSIIFNMPKFIEINVEEGLDDFSKNILYNKIYKQYMELIITAAVPWLSLVYLNLRIYLAVTRTNINRSTLTILLYKAR